jgi:hypothetical protein
MCKNDFNTERIIVKVPADTPFDSIEGSHRYIAMLFEAIEEAQADVDSEIEIAVVDGAARRKEALQIVAFNLTKLASHITASRRILNDLRTLQRLLLEERPAPDVLVKRAAE